MSERDGADRTPAFDYESALWGEEEIRPGERSIAGFRLDEALACLPGSGRVLEVGCGAGRFLRALALARPGLALCGMDVSRAALARAAALSPGVELRRVEDPAGALPASEAEFDAVLLLDVLEHVPDPDHLLREVARVLRPGGVLHGHVPCEGDRSSLWSWLPGARLRALKRELAGHLQRFRREELLRRVQGAGFEILRVRYSLHLLGNLADVGAFLGLAAGRRAGGSRGPALTTGDLLARSRAGTARERAALGARLVRAVDAALWLEARSLARIPSWGVHLSARRRA